MSRKLVRCDDCEHLVKKLVYKYKKASHNYRSDRGSYYCNNSPYTGNLIDPELGTSNSYMTKRCCVNYSARPVWGEGPLEIRL